MFGWQYVWSNALFFSKFFLRKTIITSIYTRGGIVGKKRGGVKNYKAKNTAMIRGGGSAAIQEKGSLFSASSWAFSPRDKRRYNLCVCVFGRRRYA